MKSRRFLATLACVLASGLAGYGNQLPHLRNSPPGKNLPPPRKGTLRIRPAEAAHVKFVKYQDPRGYFSMSVPLGWKVRTGLKPDGKLDLISYAITAFDPKRPERELYFCLNVALGLKSQEARNWHVRNYGAGSFFAKMPVLPELSTAGFFAAGFGSSPAVRPVP